VLRKRFTGQPEHVINYFFFVAEEVREIMAGLGYAPSTRWWADPDARPDHAGGALEGQGAGFLKTVRAPEGTAGQKIYHAEAQNHHLEAVLDRRLIEKAQAAIDRGAPVRIETEINNTDRSAGAMLSGTVAKIYGHAGLPHDTIQVGFKAPRARRLAPGWRAASPSTSKVKPTTMSARACPAAASSSSRRAIPASCRRVHHRPAHRDVRRDRGRMLFPRHRRRTFRGA